MYSIYFLFFLTILFHQVISQNKCGNSGLTITNLSPPRAFYDTAELGSKTGIFPKGNLLYNLGKIELLISNQQLILYGH